MRSEQRTQAMKLAEDFAHHMLGLEGGAYASEMRENMEKFSSYKRRGEYRQYLEKRNQTKTKLKIGTLYFCGGNKMPLFYNGVSCHIEHYTDNNTDKT